MSEQKQEEIALPILDFSTVARNIIKRSIRSAICIDDKFEQPYMSDEEINERNKALTFRDGETSILNRILPKELHKSFRVDGACDLDIYNFETLEKSWQPIHMLNNKDLMVIDWELDGKDGYESTIEILKQTINDNDFPTIPFIIIYTSTPPGDFVKIINNILSHFNPFDQTRSEILQNFYTNFISSFSNCFEEEPDSDTLSDFLDAINKRLFEYWNITSKDIRLELEGDIATELNRTFDVKEGKREKSKTKLRTALKDTFGENKDLFECLYYLSINFKDQNLSSVKRINSINLGFKINTSIVTVFSKDEGTGQGVKPEEVFNTFSDLICKDPHNFLTLLSMEMRDKLRDDSYKISDKISSLDERAFFYHMGNYKSRSINYKNEFFDFLIKSWTSEIETYNINQTPELFNIIEEYIQNKNLEKKDINNVEIRPQLADLAIKLSTTTINNRIKKDPQIRFGDIFKAEFPDKTIKYFLCITPQCVCVDACSKIDNNFFFVKSESASEDLKSALEKIEIEYYSLVKDSNISLALKWGECKPFTIWIKDNDLSILKSKYADFEIELKYVTTLKENFAQRISNKAFNYGLSIGIDLPHITKN